MACFILVVLALFLLSPSRPVLVCVGQDRGILLTAWITVVCMLSFHSLPSSLVCVDVHDLPDVG